MALSGAHESTEGQLTDPEELGRLVGGRCWDDKETDGMGSSRVIGGGGLEADIDLSAGGYEPTETLTPTTSPTLSPTVLQRAAPELGLRKFKLLIFLFLVCV